MKLMTDKMMDLEIERRMREERERVWTSERFDRLEKRMYQMEDRLATLQEKVRRMNGEKPECNIDDEVNCEKDCMVRYDG